MSHDNLGGCMTLGAICLICFVLGAACGGKLVEATWKDLARQHNAAHYDRQSGRWMWNDEPQAKSEGQ